MGLPKETTPLWPSGPGTGQSFLSSPVTHAWSSLACGFRVVHEPHRVRSEGAVAPEVRVVGVGGS